MGPEVLQRIRERDARMAVIMVTGVRVPRSAPCRLSAWERKYILKPFDPTELEHVIEYGLACAMMRPMARKTSRHDYGNRNPSVNGLYKTVYHSGGISLRFLF